MCSKATRTKAARCLTDLQGTKAYKKSVVIRSIVEKYLLKAVFAPDVESRKLVVEERFNQGLQDLLPVNREVLVKQICTTYHSKGLEIIKILYLDEERLIIRGLYDHKPVAIKIVTINPMSKLYSAQDQETSKSEKAFQNETEILQRLNTKTSNEHAPVCYAADTTKLPYHMISEYIPNGDLVHFLDVCREGESPSYRQLLKICLGIVDSMIHMHKNNIIHNRLRPEHVLLDDNSNVKVIGFSGAKILSASEMKDGFHGERLGPDDPSIRWAAPECLTENPVFSPQSDIWAFGVLLYVMFTCGRIPYANENLEKVRQDVSIFFL
jgi:serine/threonine protein kinase